MSVYTKKTLESGQVQYRKDGKLISNEERDGLDPKLLARLDTAPEGTKVPESDEVIATDDNTAPAPETKEKLVEIHLERNHMVNGKVYLGGYDVEIDPETREVVAETPIKIKVTEDMAEELLRNDRNNTTYEKNLMRGQNLARVAPQVKDVKSSY